MPDASHLIYARHVELRCQQAERALATAGFDRVLIHSGRPRMRFLDDQHPPFRAHGPFVAWLPLPRAEDHLLEVRPGEKPRLWCYRPEDFWHLPPPEPESWWAEHFEIRMFAEPGGWRDALRAGGATAIVGEAEDFEGCDPAAINPPELMQRLAEDRTVKTAWEREQVATANRMAVAGHDAARRAFHAGAGELELHLAYLGASGQDPDHLPYGNIVALNEHCAVLHYQVRDPRPPARNRSFLIDAGADSYGYAADVTRTEAASGEREFRDLIAAMDDLQRRLVDGVRPGRSFVELHREAHLGVAAILEQAGLVAMTPESMVEAGVTGRFLPHGLGHFLGVQVHDVAGQIAPGGNALPPPEDHPALRLTRELEPGNVLTIEPGLYFIPQLLGPLRESAHGRQVNWDAVDRLIPLGGIRIEDNVLVTEKSPVNYTRDAWRVAQAA